MPYEVLRISAKINSDYRSRFKEGKWRFIGTFYEHPGQTGGVVYSEKELEKFIKDTDRNPIGAGEIENLAEFMNSHALQGDTFAIERPHHRNQHPFIQYHFIRYKLYERVS